MDRSGDPLVCRRAGAQASPCSARGDGARARVGECRGTCKGRGCGRRGHDQQMGGAFENTPKAAQKLPRNTENLPPTSVSPGGWPAALEGAACGATDCAAELAGETCIFIAADSILCFLSPLMAVTARILPRQTGAQVFLMTGEHKNSSGGESGFPMNEEKSRPDHPRELFDDGRQRHDRRIAAGEF